MVFSLANFFLLKAHQILVAYPATSPLTSYYVPNFFIAELAVSSKNALFFISDSRDDIREQLLPSTILALGTDHNGKVAVIQNANSVNQLKMTSYSSTSSLNHSSNYFPLVNGVTKVLPGIFEFLFTGLYRGLNYWRGHHPKFNYQYQNFPFSKSYQFSRILQIL